MIVSANIKFRQVHKGLVAAKNIPTYVPIFKVSIPILIHIRINTGEK